MNEKGNSGPVESIEQETFKTMTQIQSAKA